MHSGDLNVLLRVLEGRQAGLEAATHRHRNGYKPSVPQTSSKPFGSLRWTSVTWDSAAFSSGLPGRAARGGRGRRQAPQGVGLLVLGGNQRCACAQLRDSRSGVAPLSSAHAWCRACRCERGYD